MCKSSSSDEIGLCFVKFEEIKENTFFEERSDFSVIFDLTHLTLIFLSRVFFFHPSLSMISWNGGSTSNEITPNGLTSNETTLKGRTSNGPTLKGGTSNGQASNGPTSNKLTYH